MKIVTIEALRPFNRTPQGDICNPGDVFDVGEVRADELARLGLARRTGAAAETVTVAVPVVDAKAAPVPENKMAPAPENKVAGAVEVGKARRARSAGPAGV